MSQSKVKVAVRIRPLTAKEILQGSIICTNLNRFENHGEIFLSCEDTDFQVSTSTGTWGSQDTMALGSYFQNERRFKFERVYSVSDQQEEVFSKSVEPIVDKFLEGYNATVFVYGQTGSGKTYTMGTDFGSATNVDDSSSGIIPRTLVKIFSHIDSCDPSLFQFKVTASYLELYNEEFIDLINPGKDRKQASIGAPRIREDGSGKVSINNVSIIEAHTVNDLLEMLKKGSICRTTGSTDMNISSSRSHAIFSITLCQYRPSQANNNDSPRETVTSRFNFVDLAGSERLKKTHATGNRMREGISINQGLLALGNVICALSDNFKRTNHIPYRDSKLTRLLQDSLGGNSETLMLACISPSNFNFSETLSTLNYASRASNISNKITIDSKLYSQMNFTRATFMKMEEELESLRSMVSVMKSQLLSRSDFNKNSSFQTQKNLLSRVDINQPHPENLDNILLNSSLNLKCTDLQKQLLSCKNEVYALRFICNKQSILIRSFQDDIAMNFTSSELNSYINEFKSLALNTRLVKTESRDIYDGELFSVLKYALSKCAEIISELNYKIYSVNNMIEWYESRFSDIAKKCLNKIQGTIKQTYTPANTQQSLKKSTSSTSINVDNDLITRELSISQVRNIILEDLNSEKRFSSLRNTLSERKDILDFIKQLSQSSRVVDTNFNNLKTTKDRKENAISDKVNTFKKEVLDYLSDIELAINERQTLIQDLKSIKTELQIVTSSYNQKLQVLENKLISMEHERDEAIKRLQNIPAPLHTLNSAGLRSLEMQNRRLKSEVSKYKKKLEVSINSNNSRDTKFSTNSSSRVTRLNSSIESLSLEKFRLLKEVKALKLKKKALQGYTRLSIESRKNHTKSINPDKTNESTDEVQFQGKKHLRVDGYEPNEYNKKVRYEENNSNSNELSVKTSDNELRIIKYEFMKMLFEVVRIKRRQKLLSKIRASRNKLLLRRRELLLERERCLTQCEEGTEEKFHEMDEREKKIDNCVETTQLELAKCEAEMENLSTSGVYRIEKKWREVLCTIRNLSGHQARAICEQLSVDFVRVLYDLQLNKQSAFNNTFNQLEHLKFLPLMHEQPNSTNEKVPNICLDKIPNDQVLLNIPESVNTNENVSSKIAKIALRLRKVIGKVITDTPSTPKQTPNIDTPSTLINTKISSDISHNQSLVVISPPTKLTSSVDEIPIYSRLN